LFSDAKNIGFLPDVWEFLLWNSGVVSKELSVPEASYRRLWPTAGRACAFGFSSFKRKLFSGENS
jgi:hypothetical protein